MSYKIELVSAFLATSFLATCAIALDTSDPATKAWKQAEVACNGVKPDPQGPPYFAEMLDNFFGGREENRNYAYAGTRAEEVLRYGQPTLAERQCALSVRAAVPVLRDEAKRRQAARETAAQRADDEAEQRRAERKRAEQATEEAPNEKLRTIYQNYITMQSCYEARKEFRVQYVTKQELDDARAVTKRDEQSLIRQFPALAKGKDAIWENAKREYQNTNLAVSLGLSGTKHNDFADRLCKLNAVRFTVDPDNRRERIKKDF